VFRDMVERKKPFTSERFCKEREKALKKDLKKVFGRQSIIRGFSVFA
jgi:hypothetical protein